MTAYDEGFSARQRGQEKYDNPYPKGTIERLGWDEGWLDLDHHFRERSAAFVNTFGHDW